MDKMPHTRGGERASGHTRSRAHVYRTTVSPLTGLLLVAPLLLIFFSLAAALLVGGALTAFVLPLFLRRRIAPVKRHQQDYIELDPDQYRRIEK